MTPDEKDSAPPFPCPAEGCGASDWIAHYMVPESQGITLVIGEDGEPEAVDYDGCTSSGDGAGDNEWYECGACRATIRLDGTLDPEPWDQPA